MAGKTSKKSAKVAKKAAKKVAAKAAKPRTSPSGNGAGPVLLSGGNPQIAKACSRGRAPR